MDGSECRLRFGERASHRDDGQGFVTVRGHERVADLWCSFDRRQHRCDVSVVLERRERFAHLLVEGRIVDRHRVVPKHRHDGRSRAVAEGALRCEGGLRRLEIGERARRQRASVTERETRDGHEERRAHEHEEAMPKYEAAPSSKHRAMLSTQ